MLRLLLLVPFICLALGCKSSPTTPTEPPVPLAVTRFDGFPQPLAEYSGMVTPTRMVVRDAATWQAVWEQIFRNQTPRPPVPQVDFTREVVAVVALGERRTGGHGIFIDDATEVSTGVTINVRTVSPEQNCVVTQALTQPVDAARLPRRDTIVFADRNTILQCR